jgi:hypothetical protein
LENKKQFFDQVGMLFNMEDVDHLLQVIACRAFSSNHVKRDLHTATAWLKATVSAAIVRLQQHVEQHISARDIDNEIAMDTKAQSIQTASKAVANALIKTTEMGPRIYRVHESQQYY